jgi:hypothetical protein
MAAGGLSDLKACSQDLPNLRCIGARSMCRLRRDCRSGDCACAWRPQAVWIGRRRGRSMHTD